MKTKSSLVITIVTIALIISLTYLANEKYATYQQKKRTMAFLAIEEGN